MTQNMEDNKQQNEYVIKLSGKAHLFEPLTISHNIEILAKGSITEEKKQDKDDGGFIVTWKFEPVTVEVKNDLGETLKTRDTRKRSVQQRSAIFKEWRDSNSKEDFDDYYDRRLLGIIDGIIKGSV